MAMFTLSLLLSSTLVTGSLLTQPTPTATYQFPYTPLQAFSPKEKLALKNAPLQKTLPTNYQIFQSFNNCGPASLSMALWYYGINESQEQLGASLRPYQNTTGIDDDKSVSMQEIAQKAEEYDLIAYHRPNGSIAMVKQFINYDIPILTRTWLSENEDIGHYRVLRGYDDLSKQIIQDDSYQGHDLTFGYDEFNSLWDKFSYEYVVLVPKEKKAIAEAIIGEDIDANIAWNKAAKHNEELLKENPSDIYQQFNLSVALYNVGQYQKSVESFEKIENDLPLRTLWYQTEPILAYYKLGKDEKVLSLTDAILGSENPAFSELYILRGKIYHKQGKIDEARDAFDKAIFFNQNLKEAKEARQSV
jgi:tetratricopeptide (TPR) repeat protein